MQEPATVESAGGSGNTDWAFGLSTKGTDCAQSQNCGDDNGEGDLTYLHAPAGAISGHEGEWHHVAGTYDGTTMKVLIDGNEVATGNDQSGDINYPHPNYLQRVNQVRQAHSPAQVRSCRIC